MDRCMFDRSKDKRHAQSWLTSEQRSQSYMREAGEFFFINIYPTADRLCLPLILVWRLALAAL